MQTSFKGWQTLGEISCINDGLLGVDGNTTKTVISATVLTEAYLQSTIFQGR